VERIPSDEVERLAVYQHVVRGLRMLLVLDNPASAADVLALAVPGGRSDLLIACRAPLGALDEAHIVRLGALGAADAHTLFVRIAGPMGGRAEPDRGLVDRATLACARLPLFIRIAASRLRTSHSMSLRDLVDRLEHPRSLVATLDDGTRSSINTFADTCAELPAAQARLFALLSVYPGETFDTTGASFVAGTPVEVTVDDLDGLLDACLIEPVAAGRYALHDVGRSVAAHRAATALSRADVDAARTRLLDGYLILAQQADLAVTPGRYRDRRVLPPSGAPPSPFHSATAAIAWFEAMRDTLVRLVELAAACGEHDTCWKLAFALRDHFFRSMGHRAYIESHTLALASARIVNNLWAVAVTANDLGLAHAQAGQHDRADGHYAEALQIFQDLDDAYGQANSLGHFAWTAHARGRHAEAVENAQAALAIYRDRGVVRNTAITQRTLALAQAALGRTDEAIQNLDEALTLFAACGLVLDEAMALNCLGEIAGAQADAPGSMHWYIRAWWRARACGSGPEQVRALRGMAAAASTVGRAAAATRLARHAAAIAAGPVA
jgi:tetratricopeptide (TPR) repeat protein